MSVVCHVRLGGFGGVVCRVVMMAGRDVRVVGRLVVIPGVVVLGGFPVMPRRMLVVIGGFFVMVRG
jgi:hypothetical protein